MKYIIHENALLKVNTGILFAFQWTYLHLSMLHLTEMIFLDLFSMEQMYYKNNMQA